jgi:hypothetical protein
MGHMRVPHSNIERLPCGRNTTPVLIRDTSRAVHELNPGQEWDRPPVAEIRRGSPTRQPETTHVGIREANAASMRLI